MPQQSSFTVYNASAGSGKTYTLVKEYLKILLQSTNLFLFKNILAITFTNKAVAEMKDRIITTLTEFSKEDILSSSQPMFNSICSELGLEPNVVHIKSKKLLFIIIHNYASFDISTIDGFTHKLIRTFAHDLRLPLNFEVELDQDALLSEAVDSLIAKVGSDKKLTKVLVDFAIEKADDDKSWDVAFDFNKIGKLLFNENDSYFLNRLKTKTLEDFKNLKKSLSEQLANTEKQIVEQAKDILVLIDEAGLEHNDFTRKSLPNHFKNLFEKKFHVKFDSLWQKDLLEGNRLYPTRVADDIASIIEEIQSQLIQGFEKTKQLVFHYRFLSAFYKHITPLSVLNALNIELEILKIEQNKILISEFNSVISNEIKNQPTPFIYERIGEKFKHYFIDEFQDTSKMQWENLIPLLDNSLSSENGSTMLVGDAKQAIYRWRGGKAEQFINLFDKTKNPFQINQEVKNLKENYRSAEEIVKFNNGFFNYLSDSVFTNEKYRNLYKQAEQEPTKNETGFVELSFLNIEKDDTPSELYAEEVLKKIRACIDQGYQMKDICILVRYKKDEKSLAKFLSAQENLKVISEDGLLLASFPAINFINNLLTLLIQPKDNTVKIAVLNFLADHFQINDKHTFFKEHINLGLPELFKSFEPHNVFINNEEILELTLYDLVETIIRSFQLVEYSNAYVQFYLDTALEFSQKKGSDISAFLEHFEKKKDKLSVTANKAENAIQIMTIHKAKGLEFPVVIFPFADLDIYAEREPKEWFPINPTAFNGFSYALMNFNKDFENYGDLGLEIYNRHKAEQELDNINLLYVALTRAEEQVYILSKNENRLNQNAQAKKYSGMFINYLKHIETWNESQFTYTFGVQKKSSESKVLLTENLPQLKFISSNKNAQNIQIVTKSGFLWDTNQLKAFEKGNLMHNIMSRIITHNDVDPTLDDFEKQGIINISQKETLKNEINNLIVHPNLGRYFEPNLTVYTEKDIITNQGIVLRPDRVVINSNNEAIIIDYKTGLHDKKYAQQLKLYEDVLIEMGIPVKKKILIYINDDISVKEL